MKELPVLTDVIALPRGFPWVKVLRPASPGTVTWIAGELLRARLVVMRISRNTNSKE